MRKNVRKKALCSQVRKEWKKNHWIYLMILPVVVYFVMFRYVPMIWLSMSFFDYKILKGFSGSEFIGLENYIDFFTSRNFWDLMRNTIVFNLGAIVVQTAAPIVLALFLNEVRNPKVKKIHQTISFLPYFVSVVIVVTMIQNIVSPSMGILNKLREAMGLSSVYYLGIPQYFYPINYISGVWSAMGWNSIVYIAALSAVDSEIYEAATIDGASRLQKILHVTLPSIRLTIAIMITMSVGSLLGGNADKLILLQNDLNLSVSELLTTYSYKLGMVNGDFGYASTVSMFTGVVSCALVILTNKLSMKISDSQVGVF